MPPPRPAVLGRLLGVGLLVVWIGVLLGAGGLLAQPARSASPVHAAAIGYRSPEVCWWGDAEFLPHLLHLCEMPRIEARVCFCEAPVASTDRKRLAEELRTTVLAKQVSL